MGHVNEVNEKYCTPCNEHAVAGYLMLYGQVKFFTNFRKPSHKQKRLLFRRLLKEGKVTIMNKLKTGILYVLTPEYALQLKSKYELDYRHRLEEMRKNG